MDGAVSVDGSGAPQSDTAQGNLLKYLPMYYYCSTIPCIVLLLSLNLNLKTTMSLTSLLLNLNLKFPVYVAVNNTPNPIESTCLFDLTDSPHRLLVSQTQNSLSKHLEYNWNHSQYRAALTSNPSIKACPQTHTQSLESMASVSSVRRRMAALKAVVFDYSAKHCDLEQCRAVSTNIYSPNLIGF